MPPWFTKLVTEFGEGIAKRVADALGENATEAQARKAVSRISGAPAKKVAKSATTTPAKKSSAAIISSRSGSPASVAKDVLNLAANPKARTDFSVWREKAPATRRGSLFDLSALNQVPNVPQFDLARTVPARGPSERIQDVIGRADVQQGLNEAVQRGLQMGGSEWYNTDPIRLGMQAARGSSYNPSQYGQLIDVISGTSPGLKVPDNIRTGSYYNYLLERGLPIPDKPAAGYGAKTQGSHVKHVRNVEAGNPWSVLENPKPPSFSQNLQGNWRPITADTHNFRAPGILSQDPRMLATSTQELVNPKKLDVGAIEASMRAQHPNFRDDDMSAFLSRLGEPKPVLVYRPRDWLKSGSISMDEAVNQPTYWSSQPAANEYGFYEKWQQDQARKMGISPAQYQAGMWVGAGDITGLGSPPEAFMHTFEDRVLYTADQLGLRPELVRDMILRGEIPMLASGGPVNSSDFAVK